MAAGALSYPVRHPRWVLIYRGVNITTDIWGMVIEVSYTDKVEHLSDELELTVEDRDRRWQRPWFPGQGDNVTLQIGYEGEQHLNCGDFQVDELELKGPPDTFHLKCIAAGITPTIRTPRSAGYEPSTGGQQTLLQVAQVVAQRQNMTVAGDTGVSEVAFARITQKHETDLHFLRRLAQAHNYDFSIRGLKGSPVKQLVFFKRTTLEQAEPVRTILRTQVKTFEFKTRTQQIYKTASVAYQNPATKQLIGAQVGDDGAPTGDDLHIITRCENVQQAQLKAQSALHDANMFQVTSRVELEGTPLLVAGKNIMIQGFGAFDGKYHIESSKHRVERSSGYTTEIEARNVEG